MRTVVTGGAGFIGSNLVDRLLTAGHQVTIVDDFSRGSRANLIAATKQAGNCVQVIEADIRDPDLDRQLDASVNILGTINVAEAARGAGVRKIVFASSGGSIYGEQSKLPISET